MSYFSFEYGCRINIHKMIFGKRIIERGITRTTLDYIEPVKGFWESYPSLHLTFKKNQSENIDEFREWVEDILPEDVYYHLYISIVNFGSSSMDIELILYSNTHSMEKLETLFTLIM